MAGFEDAGTLITGKHRPFNASEVAEFEYCPLAWWYEQFEPAARMDNEELFARLVELEHEHNTQAPVLPEYRLVEQLLLRRGAFEVGRRQHQEHAEAVASIDTTPTERFPDPPETTLKRFLPLALALLGTLGLLLLFLALLVR